ncbi:MAG: hypothetical protein ACK559_42400 [bacterium]
MATAMRRKRQAETHSEAQARVASWHPLPAEHHAAGQPVLTRCGRRVALKRCHERPVRDASDPHKQPELNRC